MNTHGLCSSQQAAPGPDGRIERGEQRLLARARLGKTPALSLYPSALGSRRGGAAQSWLVRARRKSRSHEITVRLDHLSQTIVLPKGSLDPGLATRVRGAVKRYCQSQIRHNRHALVALRWPTLSSLTAKPMENHRRW